MLELLLNGASSGKGFLMAPAGSQVFSGTLELRLIAEPDIDVIFRTAAGSALAIFFDQPTAHLTTTTTSVKLHATHGSSAINDTVIEVVAGTNVLAQLKLTVVQNPILRYFGRFQCRLATDPDPFNSPWGMNSSFGMYAVQGPDPTNPDEPPLDRMVRLKDSVALRPFCEPVGTTIAAIEGTVGSGKTSFNTADPIFDLPVNLGSNSKFESQDGAFAQPGFEPISEFEFSIGRSFFDRSAAAVPRTGSDPPGSTAPFADGLFRLDEVGPWKPSDFGYSEPTWAVHSEAVTAAKKVALLAQAPGTPAATRIRDRRLQEHNNNLGGIRAAMRLIERYSGIIDRELSIIPGNSAMLMYSSSFTRFAFRGEFFNFDTDAQSGTVTGTIAMA